MLKGRCLLLIGLLAIAGLGGTAQPPKADRIALIVAVGNYPSDLGWIALSAENDITILKNALEKQGFSKNNIAVLKDEQATRQGILDAIRIHLINMVKTGDAAVFHFSGHGQQVWDNNGDEIDGYDEAIVPYDSPKHFQAGVYEGENLIRDEEVGSLLKEVRIKLGPDGHLLALIDACHSGTATRGIARARGTNLRMASQEYIATHLNTTGKVDTLAFETAETEGLARMAAFFSSSPHQLSYEYSDEQGNEYGLLSYAFSKAFTSATENTTYRSLFDQIRLQASAQPLQQNPQAEGLLDEQVLGGKIMGAPKYFLPEWVGSTAVLNAGALAGLHDNTLVAFYPAETYDTTGRIPVALGTVSNATLLNCDVELPGFRLARSKVYWVFIREPNYGNLFASLRLDVPPGSLQDVLRTLSSECPAIHFAESNPDLVLEELRSKGQLLLLSKGEYGLDTFSLPPDANYQKLMEEVLHRIVDFAQAKFLRPVEISDSRLNAALEFFTGAGAPIRLGEKGGFRVGEEVRLRIRNTGPEPFYFSMIDIQPDNRLTVLIPWDKPAVDYYLLPGTYYDFEVGVTIAEPAGTEVLKLIASEEPLDLSNVVNTRGEEKRSGHPLEVLVRETYLNDTTRGGMTSNLPGGGVSVQSVVFEIRK